MRTVADNRPEFRGVTLDGWAYEHGVTLEFIDPVSPIQNAVMESCNGRIRDECLNVNLWSTITEARDGIGAHRADDDDVRSHGSPNHRMPSEFARELRDRASGVRVA